MYVNVNPFMLEYISWIKSWSSDRTHPALLLWTTRVSKGLSLCLSLCLQISFNFYQILYKINISTTINHFVSFIHLEMLQNTQNSLKKANKSSCTEKYDISTMWNNHDPQFLGVTWPSAQQSHTEFWHWWHILDCNMSSAPKKPAKAETQTQGISLLVNN